MNTNQQFVVMGRRSNIAVFMRLCAPAVEFMEHKIKHMVQQYTNPPPSLQ